MSDQPRRADAAAQDAAQDDAAGPPQALPPPVLNEAAQVTAPLQVASGLPSIAGGVRRMAQQTGLRRGIRTLRRLNQPGGFDCPGCAWPNPDADARAGAFCAQGVRAVADEATTARITAGFFAKWSIRRLSAQTDRWLNRQGRLTQPMVLRPGRSHYTPIAWEDAFQRIADVLQGLDTPDEAVFYSSGRTSNEAAFLLQLFARRYGTNNLPNCANLCHESSEVALKAAIGGGKATVTLDDFDRAEVIVLIGQNPGSNHPRMLTALARAKSNGAIIISINPLPEAGLLRFKQPQNLKHPLGLVRSLLGQSIPITDQFLPVRINGDVALLKGLAKALLEAEDRDPGTVLDRRFIGDKTVGFEAFARDVRAADWDVIVEESGLERSAIRQAAEVLRRAERVIYCWAMGLTQHKNGVGNIQMVANLALMRGAIGKPGAGLCPVRGHANVQGTRTMGITPHPPPGLLDRMTAVFRFTPPRVPGLDTVEAIQSMHAGRVKAFFSLGGNFLSATPDTAYTAEALRRCQLTVQVSTKLNRAHLVTGREALILPCLGRTEMDVQRAGTQFVTVENTMGVVHRSQGLLAPASEHLLSEPAIVARMGEAVLGPQPGIDWRYLAAHYDRVRERIAAVIPGFEDYNLRVREPAGFSLPNAARQGRFKTPTGRARFTVHAIPRRRLDDGRLLMMTIRSHGQFNTTIYSHDDRYRGIRGERRVVLLHPDDLKARGLKKGDVVDLTSHFEGETRTARRFVVVPYPIPRSCAATYFPEANPLVPLRSVADKSNTPASKSVVITIARAR